MIGNIIEENITDPQVLTMIMQQSRILYPRLGLFSVEK